MPCVVREDRFPELYQKLYNRNLLWQYDYLSQGVRLAIDHLRDPNPRFTANFLLSLHHFAVVNLSQTPGRVRTDFVSIEGSDHAPPHPDHVEKLFLGLTHEVNNRWELSDPVELAAYVLWRLTWVHPFEDGNGRTARAACYYVICVKLGRVLPGRRMLPEQFRADPKSFYACLHHADETASTDPGGKADLRPLQGLLTTVLKQQLQS